MLRYRTYCLDGRVKVALLPMRAEELKGYLDALLLAALEGGPRHGYAVIEALRQDSGGRLDLPTGTIYPALRRAGRRPGRSSPPQSARFWRAGHARTQPDRRLPRHLVRPAAQTGGGGAGRRAGGNLPAAPE